VTVFAHAMPFGAELQPDGSIRFQLWAPTQQRVSVALSDCGAVLPLCKQENGWFELVTDAAPVGSRYRLELQDGMRVPDPASRYQPEDVHGPSVVIDPRAYSWRVNGWRGRPWHEAICYELHVGAFGPEGDFNGVRRRLDRLERLGVTAIELMPLADFPGRRNWGYDGVLPFAPDASYGTPAALKALVDAAHERGLMIFLDVVYNHFGPDGNYLWLYAPQFFTERHHTPWGPAIDFSQRPVRDFFINNALYWLTEYQFDGLRLDAVHAIVDDSPTHILVELAAAVHQLADGERHLHLVLENDANAARLLRRDNAGHPLYYDAQWNDDFHHVCHVLLTGESAGYYADYADRSLDRLGRALAEGFIYQGEASRHRGGAARGGASRDLPPTAFVDFLQNHDQIGNRAFGDRLATLANPHAIEAVATILLLAPQVPLLFMGEEWGATQPFLFFCDFQDELAEAVSAGRRREFAKFPEFSDPVKRELIRDPNAADTFAQSVLDWTVAERSPHRERLALYEELLALRRSEIVPRLAGIAKADAKHELLQGEILRVSWRLVENSRLTLVARLSDNRVNAEIIDVAGRMLRSTHPAVAEQRAWGALPGWFVAWFLAERKGGA
jgi:malto-oligosyltrehalose trehalohydrolase